MPREKKRLGLRVEPRPYIGLDPLVQRMLEILDDFAEIERVRLRHIAAVRMKQWKHSEEAKNKSSLQMAVKERRHAVHHRH